MNAPASASRSCSSVASVGRPVMKHVSVSVPSDDATKGTGPRYKMQHSERSREEQQGQALRVHTPEGHEDTYAAHATRDTPCSHHKPTTLHLTGKCSPSRRVQEVGVGVGVTYAITKHNTPGAGLALGVDAPGAGLALGVDGAAGAGAAATSGASVNATEILEPFKG